MLTPSFSASKECKSAQKLLLKSNEVKLSKKFSGLTYSYLHQKENKCIYRVSRVKLAEKSGESFYVKEVYGDKLEVYAAKVGFFIGAVDPEQLPEVQVLRKLGRLKDVIIRKLDTPKSVNIDEGTAQEKSVRIDHKLYIIQEKIPGENLEAWLLNSENRQLLSQNKELGLQIAVKLIARLDALHRLGIVHGDIKPANIMLAIDGDGNVEVDFVDFGNAALLAESNVEVIVDYQGGTPFYRAPELEERQQEGYILGHQGDVYSLGMVLDSNIHFPFSNEFLDKLLSADRMQRATLPQLASFVMESLFAQQLLHGLHNPHLKMLLKAYETNGLSFDKIKDALLTLKPKLSPKQKILADLLIEPNHANAKATVKKFSIKKGNFVSSMFHPYTKDDLNRCNQVIDTWVKEKDIGELAYDVKTKQSALFATNPIHNFYAQLLSVLREVQGPIALAEIEAAYPSVNGLAGAMQSKLAIV